MNGIFNKDIYVNDCISGKSCIKNTLLQADKIGGFKGVAFSDEDSPKSLSDERIRLDIEGMRLYARNDEWSQYYRP